MRVLGMSAVGIVTLLGSPAWADLPVVQEAHTVWEGCDYAIRVEQDVDPIPYPRPLYRVSVHSSVVSADTCTLEPRTVVLGTSMLEPHIAIAANEQGLVAAFSGGEYVRAIGPYAATYVRRLEPSTLATLRQEMISAGWTSAPGTAGGPGTADVVRLAIYPTHVELKGIRSGNLVTAYPSGDSRFEEGTGFAAFYSNFFGVNQKPPILFVY